MDTLDVRAEDVAAVVAEMLGPSAAIAEWWVEPVAYQSGSPATGGLCRVRGVTEEGQRWSVFGKLLCHVRHWPLLGYIPEVFRENFAAEFPWRSELAAWEPSFVSCLPDGLRIPKLYRITDLGDDRLMVWMENIETLDDTWDVTHFARAARLLGGLAAMRSASEIVDCSGYPTGFGLRTYCDNRVMIGSLPVLDADDIWAHPLIVGAVDPLLREDMRRLAQRLPAILDRLDSLTQALPHGDASPQNLLIPANAPDEFVAIDIAFQAPHAIGFDLGQLAVGLVHAGEMRASALPAAHEVLVPSFAAGLKEAGLDLPEEEIFYGYVGSLVVRAGFTSIPFETLGAPPTPERVAMFRERAALTRFIVDLGLQLRPVRLS
jgi:hypothetical protein